MDDTWPQEQWTKYPHPKARGNKIKTIAKLEKLAKTKRPGFEAKMAELICYCKQEKWYNAPMMQTFVNNWEGLEYDVKAIRPADERRSTVKEFTGHADRAIDNEEHFRKLKEIGYLR
jgi:hypothetical protein